MPSQNAQDRSKNLLNNMWGLLFPRNVIKIPWPVFIDLIERFLQGDLGLFEFKLF
jgi:hypothetical protein